MDSRILTALQHYPIKDGTNRYCFTKVVYPQNAFACSLLVEDDNLSQQKESTDDDAIIEGECFVYIAGKQIFTIELKQPEFVHQQMCIDMSKDQAQLVCLAAFPLPTHLHQHHKVLPIATAILVIQVKDANQRGRLFFDNAEELQFQDCEEFLNRRIIWINSRYISNQYILLIVGYNNCNVSIFYLCFEEKVQIVHVQTFEFDQLVLFNDIAYWNDYFVALVSFDGQIEILNISHEEDQIETMKIKRYSHIIGRITSQPKFYYQDQELRLMIPIQKGQLLIYENIEKCQLKQYKIMKCPNSNNSLTTGFDIQKKRESPFTESEEYELCFLHFDGTLEIYEMIENALQIEILKQMNFTRYFVSNMQLQFKQFLLLASDDDIDIYQIMDGDPQRIISKQIKQPNTVLYEVEFLIRGSKLIKNWVELERLIHYLHLIEEYELNCMSSQYTETIEKFDQIPLENIKQSQLLIHKVNNTKDAINNKMEYIYSNQQIQKDEPFELNKELKKITKQYFKGIQRNAQFDQENIVKIITYAKDELDVNKYTFLIQWKQRTDHRPILPSWISQTKMEQFVPDLIKQYAEEKNIKLI